MRPGERALPGLALSVLLVGGCLPVGGRTTVPLLAAAGIPSTPTPLPEVPLELVTHAAGAPDPLPVGDSGVAYTEVEEALGHALASAVVPWAEEHRGRREDGYQLLVELVHARAGHRGGRTRVALDVRATLRARRGQQFLAQTWAHCQEASLTGAQAAAPVLYGCMGDLARDLAGWLGAVEP